MARQAELYKFGEFELNLTAHKLYRNGAEVDLTPREFRRLTYMVVRRGCALARKDILNAVVEPFDDGDAAEHRQLCGDAAGENGTRPGEAFVYRDDSRHWISL
jgi:hypothetical protein